MVTSPFMQKALDLAEQALRITSPNPRVGCVIVSAQGHLVGQGHTQRAGGPHAEIVALQDAASRNLSVEGATVYVTLEPCAHHGKTGPCCDSLIKAKVAKVVIAMVDPNPLVAGKSIDRLKAAQIQVELGDGAAASAALNPGFLSRMTRQKTLGQNENCGQLGRPNCLAKMARVNGSPGPRRVPMAMLGVHVLAPSSLALARVLEDNPLLDLRLSPQADSPPRMPHLVIVDSRLDTPPRCAFV
jgi:diaminohydroxyphosphoribosylaminopyrimidine deaminase / 5-amino-6-(5-phosphoribosylamino)uracil reductase